MDFASSPEDGGVIPGPAATAAAGDVLRAVWQIHRRLSVQDAFQVITDPPSIDVAVVCHRDTCAPNTLIENGQWSGHVDVGNLGVADRWGDIAIAAWSTDWNYGPGWTDTVLDAHDVETDVDRMRDYRLLWGMA